MGRQRRPLDGRSLWGSRIYCRIVFGARIVMAIPFSVAFSLWAEKVGIFRGSVSSINVK
jgi:hypothetical protein